MSIFTIVILLISGVFLYSSSNVLLKMNRKTRWAIRIPFVLIASSSLWLAMTCLDNSCNPAALGGWSIAILILGAAWLVNRRREKRDQHF